MEQPSLLETTNRMLVCGPPLIAEGLRGLGCDVVANSGFLQQLPTLVVRYGPDVVVVHADALLLQEVTDVLTQLRARTRLTRIVVLAPSTCPNDVRATVAGLDCELVAQDCESELLRDLLGVSPAMPSIRLTAREVSVLQLTAQGLTNRAIGARLQLRENTVKNYLRHLHEKLDVHSRTEAVMAAARMGYPVLPTR